MTGWHRQKGIALALRAVGLFLLSAAWVFSRYLARLLPPGIRSAVTMRELLVGGLLVFSATLGSALLILGPHLFDKVRVSERWVRLPPIGTRGSNHT